MKISVRHDFRRFERGLDDLRVRQLPYATARALNDVAEAAQKTVTGDLPRIFDRPTPFTMRSIAVTRATKASLTATVFVRPIQAQYLLHEEIGGERTPAENTNKPSTALIVPSKAPLNAFGNLPFGLLKRLVAEADEKRELTARQIRRRKSYQSSRKARDKGVFYLAGHGIGGRGPGGFFKRLPNHQVQRLLSFEAGAHYKPRFGFHDRVTIVATKAFRAALIKRLREALATAR